MLAHMALTKAYRQQLHSTNSLPEIECRTDVVGIFPKVSAIPRLERGVSATTSDAARLCLKSQETEMWPRNSLGSVQSPAICGKEFCDGKAL